MKEKMTRCGGILVAVLCVCVLTVRAASVDMSADAWETDTQKQATVTKDGTTVTVGFGPESSPPSAFEALLVASAAGDGAAFAGDFVAAGIKGIAFQLQKSAGAAAPRVEVQLRSGGRYVHHWSYRVGANADGSATDVCVPLDIPGTRCPDGWSHVLVSGEAAHAAWATQVRNVYSLSLRVTRGTKGAESCVLSGFELKGDDFVYPFDINLDSDGDGMSDLAEEAAGTDANDKDDVFQTEMTDVVGEGVTIRWRCVSEATYKVERAGSLNGTFTALATVVAPAADYATYTDATATGEGPYFYRVSKQ